MPTSSGLPQSESQSKLGHKLRHLLDPITANKHAHFHATIVIHDLVNVPLVNGDFAVRWKFRGREGGGGDSEVPTPQDSSALPSLNPSMTSLPLTGALPSSLTASSSTIPVTIPANPNINAPTNTPPKSMSMPPPPLSAHRTLNKKASDPTPATSSPLTRSFNRSDTKIPLKLTRSPSIISQGGDVSPASTEQGGSAPASIDLNEDDVDSSSSRSVPFPRANQATTDSLASEMTASSVTAASSSSTQQELGVDKKRRLPHLSLPSHMHRHSSNPNLRQASTTSIASSNTSPPRSLTLHNNRSRSSITSVCSSTHTQTPKATSTSTGSDHRKGQTPTKALKAHCCTWDFRLDHQLKIVVGKLGMATPVNDGIATRDFGNGSQSNVRQDQSQPRPILGGGPHSASTIKFTVNQIVHQRHEVGKAVMDKALFGELDLDLAAFAGKGVVTRRYLLKGSKSNATIKLSIELKWLSGEENWIAPQIKDGHHVARLMPLPKPKESDHLGADLRLTQSNTNSSSSSLSTMARNPSSTSIPPPMSRQISSTSINGGAHFPAFQGSSADVLTMPNTTTYTSVDQHLKKKRDDDEESVKSAKSVKSVKSIASDKSPSKRPRDRLKDQFSKLTQPSPASNDRAESPHRHRHHTHHIHHLPVNIHRGPTHLPPDYAIEALFNPVPGLADSPFTYAAKPGTAQVSQETLAENLRQVVMSDEHSDGHSAKSSHEGERTGKLGWNRMRNRITRDKEAYHRMIANRNA